MDDFYTAMQDREKKKKAILSLIFNLKIQEF